MLQIGRTRVRLKINAAKEQYNWPSTFILGRSVKMKPVGIKIANAVVVTGAATRIELKRFVRRLEYAGLVGVFDVEAGALPAARGSRLREDIKAGNVQVSLAVKGTNRRIETFKDLAEVGPIG
jgi:hypothetical protein